MYTQFSWIKILLIFINCDHFIAATNVLFSFEYLCEERFNKKLIDFYYW